MKIYDRGIRKLVCIQYYGEFIEDLNLIRENENLKILIKKAETMNIKEIELPDVFEGIIYNNINLKCISKNVYKLDMIKIRNMLLHLFDEIYYISKEEMSKEVENLKYALVNSEEYTMRNIRKDIEPIKTDLVIELLKGCEKIIQKYFKIHIYGFPNKNILCYLMNLIIKKEFKIISETSITYNEDLHSLNMRIKIEFLETILREKCPDISIEEELKARGFWKELFYLDNALQKNKASYIRIEHTIALSTIGDDEGENISRSINEKYEEEINNYKKEYIKEIETLEKKAKNYIDYRFNKRRSIKEIKILLEQTDIPKSALRTNIIKKELNNLAQIMEIQEQEIWLENNIDRKNRKKCSKNK